MELFNKPKNIFNKIKVGDLKFKVSNHTNWIYVNYENQIVTIKNIGLGWKLERLLDKFFLTSAEEKIDQDYMVNKLLNNMDNWTIRVKELTEEETLNHVENIWCEFNKSAELLTALKLIKFDKGIFIE